MKTTQFLKRIGIAVVILFFTLSHLFSQDQSNEDWKLVSSSSEIDIYVQFAQCDGEPIYFFKLVNSSKVERSVKLTIDIQPEPSFGPVIFEQIIPANGQSVETCDDADLTLPRMFPYTEELLSKIDVNLTIN